MQNKRTSDRIRVLVVDDSVVARLLVSEALHADPALELAGTAANGRIALEKLDELAPDVVVLDVEMPELDGLETLKAIRARHRRLPVVMFSTLTSRGQSTTLDALTYGASDYVTKPTTGSREDSVQVLQQELLPKLKALGARRAVTRTAVPAPRGIGAVQPVEVLAIGCSTGGPNALADLLPALPADLGVPVVIVQHMPPNFTKMLADRLTRLSALPVVEARGGDVLEPNQVYLAPGGLHMTVVRQGLSVGVVCADGPLVRSCRPSVDVLFQSVASAYRGNVLGVVMTGMGADGLDGSRALVEAGGRVVVQDEASSVVYGMNRHVVDAGLADAVRPLDRLAAEITTRILTSRRQTALR
jgi:two-component system chemotaxis response regulator CheB